MMDWWEDIIGLIAIALNAVALINHAARSKAAYTLQFCGVSYLMRRHHPSFRPL
jgi:hypothetical protein